MTERNTKTKFTDSSPQRNKFQNAPAKQDQDTTRASCAVNSAIGKQTDLDRLFALYAEGTNTKGKENTRVARDQRLHQQLQQLVHRLQHHDQTTHHENHH